MNADVPHSLRKGGPYALYQMPLLTTVTGSQYFFKASTAQVHKFKIVPQKRGCRIVETTGNDRCRRSACKNTIPLPSQNVVVQVRTVQGQRRCPCLSLRHCLPLAPSKHVLQLAEELRGRCQVPRCHVSSGGRAGNGGDVRHRFPLIHF